MENFKKYKFMDVTGFDKFKPGTNPNTGRSASQFASKQTTSGKEQRVRDAKKAGEAERLKAYEDLHGMQTPAADTPKLAAPKRSDYDRSMMGLRAYEMASSSVKEYNERVEKEIARRASEKVKEDDRQRAMLEAGKIIDNPGQAPDVPEMSGNRVRDRKALKKYQKELSDWKKAADAYLDQQAYVDALEKKAKEEEEARKAQKDTNIERKPQDDFSPTALNAIRSIRLDKGEKDFSIGLNKGMTTHKSDGNGGVSPTKAITASFDFLSADEEIATINGGSLYHAPNKYDVASTEVTVGGGTIESPHWVILEYTIGTSISILATTMTSVPTGSKTKWYFGLHQVYINASGYAAVVPNGGRRCFGDIVIGAFWSPSP